MKDFMYAKFKGWVGYLSLNLASLTSMNLLTNKFMFIM